jgi:hypothetical protein
MPILSKSRVSPKLLRSPVPPPEPESSRKTGERDRKVRVKRRQRGIRLADDRTAGARIVVAFLTIRISSPCVG